MLSQICVLHPDKREFKILRSLCRASKKRGLFQSSTGVLLNADVNGALNILRKVSGDSPVKEIISSGLVNRPVTAYLCGNKLNCKSLYSASPVRGS